MHGIVEPAGAYTLLREVLLQSLRVINQKVHPVRHHEALRVLMGELQALSPFKVFLIERDVAPLALNDPGQLVELRQPHRRLKVGDAEVVAHPIVQVDSALEPPVVLQHQQLAEEFFRIGHDQATLAQRDCLVREERQAGHLAKGTHRPAAVLHSQPLGRVLDDPQAVLPGERHHPIHVGRVTVDVHRHERLRAPIDRPLYLI